MVERTVRDREAGSSNLPSPTRIEIEKTMKTNWLFIGSVVVLTFVGLSFARDKHPVAPYLRKPYISTTPSSTKPAFKEDMSYTDGSGEYECSQPIRLTIVYEKEDISILALTPYPRAIALK